MNIYKQIYNQIKKYNKIILARHIGADPDALGSTLGLKEAIKNTFPKKEVYVVGMPAMRHKYIGQLDKFTEDMYEDSLLIVLDTPDVKRIDGVDPSRFKYKIKIDHHPFVEKFADIELIDDASSSASQLVVELIMNSKLKLNDLAGEKLYIGIVGDTNRFLHSYTSSETFRIASYLLKNTNINITKIYENMYSKSFDDIKVNNYITNNLTITDNGFGFIKLSQETLDKLSTDVSTAANVINELPFIIGMYSWAIFAYDKVNDNIRVSIRSRGPIINEVAMKYNGGGHIFASGARIANLDIADDVIKDLDEVCKKYKEDNNL